MGVFEARTAYKPFEYPECERFVDAISHSYWLVSEFSFISDIQDFHTKLTPKEQSVIKNALLAIAQVEVGVKKFWSRLGDRCPKPEFEDVGVAFGNSERIHSSAYSKLLEVLGFDEDFGKLLENDVMKGRVDYLSKYIKGAPYATNENYTLHLALFSLFTETASLFWQFYVIKSFASRKGNFLKDVDNVIQSTQQEEALHGLFGAYLLNLIKQEQPEWFDETFYNKLAKAAKKAYEAEEKIVDWVFEQGDLDFIDREEVKAFARSRFNLGLSWLGAQPLFEVSEQELARFDWFNSELQGVTEVDFFYQRSVNYTKNTQSFTESDLF